MSGFSGRGEGFPKTVALGWVLAIHCVLLLIVACGQESRESPTFSLAQEIAPSKRAGLEGAEGSTSAGTLVVMLGTGTPVPNPKRSGPSVAVVAGHRYYIVDFGPGVVRRVVAAAMLGIPALQGISFNRAFVTHLHSDHTAGYADLILSSAVMGRKQPLQVYGPPGIEEMTRHILAAYEQDMRTRSGGRSPKSVPAYSVQAKVIEPGEIYADRNVKVTAFEVKHGDWEHAFGFRFDTDDRSIVISGDTAPTDAVVEACSGCDVLVHEVYCQAGMERGPRHFQVYHRASHTSTKQLAALAAEARPKLLVLYHLLFFGCTEEQLLSEITSSYEGKVALANDLDVY